MKRLDSNILKIITITVLISLLCKSGYSQSSTPDKKISYKENEYYGNNIIRYHLLDVIINEFTLSYERIINKGKIGIEIPITLGYNQDPVEIIIPTPIDDIYCTNHTVTQYETGININLYPGGQGRFKYYLGPGLHFGTGYWYQYIDFDEDYEYETSDPIKTGFFKFFINNGFIFSPVKSFSFSLNGYLGIQNAFEATDNKTETNYGLSFDLIIRF